MLSQWHMGAPIYSQEVGHIFGKSGSFEEWKWSWSNMSLSVRFAILLFLLLSMLVFVLLLHILLSYLFIVSLLIVIFAVDCDISPSLPLSESSEQSLLLPVDIVLPLVFAHRCCFKPPLALDDPVNGWLLWHLSYHACCVLPYTYVSIYCCATVNKSQCTRPFFDKKMIAWGLQPHTMDTRLHRSRDASTTAFLNIGVARSICPVVTRWSLHDCPKRLARI